MAQSPNFIVRQGEPSRTALQVAALRAVHQLLDEPLVLPDPLALSLMGASTEAALRADPFALNDPLSRGLRGTLVARSRFVEDEFLRCVTAGVRQFVVLGAGLDTLACRNPWREAGVQMFEVDHPGTQHWKQRRLADAGIPIPQWLHFVPLDLETDDLADALGHAGFRRDRPAGISWLGVTLYLSVDAVMSILRRVAGFAAGTALCFDYRLPATMLNPVKRVIHEVMAAQLAAAGEPWLSHFDPLLLCESMRAMGFALAESISPEELNRRYFARRKDGLRVGGGVHLMRALTGPRA